MELAVVMMTSNNKLIITSMDVGNSNLNPREGNQQAEEEVLSCERVQVWGWASHIRERGTATVEMGLGFRGLGFRACCVV